MRIAWIVCPVLAATAFAFVADAICPGTLNEINKGLMIVMYVVAGWTLAKKGK